MKVVALVSGGKDSCYNMMKCVEYGHEIACIANLAPPDRTVQELDSWMFQTVGHNVIASIAECMGVPLYRGDLHAVASQKTLEYDNTITKDVNENDEVEELYELLSRVKNEIPDVKGVSCGAIFSDYQRNRVENVCSRLGLVSLCYLWRRDQSELLVEMIDKGINAVLMKTAALGLSPYKHCGKSLSQLQPMFEKLKVEAGLNVCGEGGEYETITLDCPIFQKRIIVDKSSVVCTDQDMFAPVGHLLLEEWHLETKTELDDILVPSENAATIATFTWGPVDELESVERNILDELKDHVICEISVSPTKHGIPNRFAYVCARMTETAPKQGVYESPYFQMRALFEVLNSDLTSRLQLSEPTKHMLQNVLVVRNMGDFSEINRAYSQYFGVSPPSRVCIECNTIQGCVTIESVVQISNPDFSIVDYGNTDASVFAKKVLHVQSVSEWAPACIGPYSQATVMCNIIRSAGQVALLPQTMNIVDASVKIQAIQCMKNVHHTLTALNSCIHNVVRCVLYVDGENVTEESDKRVVESIGTWNNYLAGTQDEDYVEQYKRSDIPAISDFFKVVYVSKLPKLSAVEYHTTALNNKGGKVTLTTLESAHPLRAQKLVIQDTYSETTFIAVSIIGNDSIEDSLVEKVAGYANSAAKKESVKIQICRVFTKSTSLGIFSAQLAEWAAIQGIPFSVVPCTRLALLDGQECQLCCEFELL